MSRETVQLFHYEEDSTKCAEIKTYNTVRHHYAVECYKQEPTDMHRIENARYECAAQTKRDKQIGRDNEDDADSTINALLHNCSASRNLTCCNDRLLTLTITQLCLIEERT